MIKRLVNYIAQNLSLEFHNFPLWIPVFIACGIGFYFHLFTEPKAWVTYTVFGLSLFILIFVNFGNSSDKIKKYKKLFAWSTLKYILKKSLKLVLFLFFIPILGHITIFLLIAGWLYSIFEYSKFIKYFALLYDNSLMKEILKGLKHIFSPVINYIKKTFLFNFSKDVVKTSRKKHKTKKTLQLLIKKTKSVSDRVIKIFKRILKNPLFLFIFFINKKIHKFLIMIKNKIMGFITFFIPQIIIDRTLKFIFSLNFILFFFILGFFVIKLRTDTVNTKLLFNKLKAANVTARLVEVEYFENAYRFTLDKVVIENYPDIKLDKIRVKSSRKNNIPQIGSTVNFTADLYPPFEPDVVGGFDFARYSYYKKLSASGKLKMPWTYGTTQIKNGWLDDIYFKFLNMRDGINKKISKLTSPDTSGVIMSMMTGERYSVSKQISDNYNRAGISHLLSISGLHMTLIVTVAFLLIRLLLAFCMPIATRYNTKKIAVFFALYVAIFYLFLSGARIPTQRAFLMILFALIAILLDRSPFSLRFLSITAILILLLSPEAIINAGFQMSFLAVITLIKLYEQRHFWFICEGNKSTVVTVSNIMWANILTAFFTGLAISPIVIYHFHNFQIYSQVGNFFAIPICSVIVMPSILFAFFLMPFGLEFIPLYITQMGVKCINYIAGNVSSLPYSSIMVKTMPTFCLICIVGGFLWFFLWQRRWRMFGLIPVAVGVAIYIIRPTPSLFGNKYAQVFGIASNDILQVVSSAKYYPPYSLIVDWKTSVAIHDFKMIKDKQFFTINNTDIAIIDRYSDYKKACESSASVIFAGFDKSKAFYKCNKLTFDKQFFYNAKGAEFYFLSDKIYYKTVADYIGHRPWNIADWKQDNKLPKNILYDLKILK